MPCQFKFGWTEMGNTVPYPPARRRFRHGRSNNHGFVDLRGKPEAVALIAETADSPELANWLTELASNGSPLWSLGCDVGRHVEPHGPVSRRHMTGGYVQLIAADYAHAVVEDYKRLAEVMAPIVERNVSNDIWELDFLLQTVQLNLDSFDDRTVSLSIEFNAIAETREAARASRERLIATLRTAYGEARLLAAAKFRHISHPAVPSSNRAMSSGPALPKFTSTEAL